MFGVRFSNRSNIRLLRSQSSYRRQVSKHPAPTGARQAGVAQTKDVVF